MLKAIVPQNYPIRRFVYWHMRPACRHLHWPLTDVTVRQPKERKLSVTYNCPLVLKMNLGDSAI